MPEFMTHHPLFYGLRCVTLGSLWLLSTTVALADETALDANATGRWVEVKGNARPGRALVTDVVEVARDEGDTDEKLEFTAPVELSTPTKLRLLGYELSLTEATVYENLARERVDAFTPVPGEWLRVKARRKPDGTLQARTVRRAEPRGTFKVVGAVLGVQERERALELGGLRLNYVRNAEMELLDSVTDPLAELLEDEQTGAPLSLRFGENLRIGGQVYVRGQHERDFDLERRRRRDRTDTLTLGKLDGLLTFAERRGRLFAEAALEKANSYRQNRPDPHSSKEEISRLSVSWRLNQDVFLIAGRQDFRDSRQYLHREVLDGVRAVYRHNAIELDGGYAIGRRPAAGGNDFEDTRMATLTGTWHASNDWRLSAYTLHRDDDAQGYDLALYGVRSYARPRYGLGHWVEVGGASGRAESRSVRGLAVDGGATYTFDRRFRPTFGAGLAHAGGRGDAASRSGYRQSGLQANSAKLGGVTRVHFYGELFDPELSNLTASTLLAAIRPFSGASFSVLYHDYRQDAASARMPLNELRISPNGRSRDLGREFDLVFGYRPDSRLAIEAIAARFFPGAAYDRRNAASFFELTMRYGF